MPIVKIVKEDDDPERIIRISMGGTTDIGYYVVFRGDMKNVMVCLKACSQALTELSNAVNLGYAPLQEGRVFETGKEGGR